MDCLGQTALPHRCGIWCPCGRTKRLCSVTASLGRRKNLCMVESMSSVEQRLRRVTNHKCDLCLCRDDAFDAQTTCCLILFKQALTVGLRPAWTASGEITLTLVACVAPV